MLSIFKKKRAGSVDRPLKVLMVYTANMNFGDTVIGRNNRYLLGEILKDIDHEILECSIFSRDTAQVACVDALVFAGGIIKSTTESFWLYLSEMIEAAQEHGVPVLLNGVGCEPFYPEDERAVSLKRALNLPCVKAITVRDDNEALRRDWIVNPSIRVTPVVDVATWSACAYASHLGEMKSTGEPLIGLGVTREKLFADYGNPIIDRDRQLEFWKDVVRSLEAQGLPWKIFTNGDSYDEAFAQDVLDYVGSGSKMPVPFDDAALVRDISRFTGVIAGRMHSNIISYALGIPSVGFVWNQKLAFWAERIGHPERFLAVDEFDGEEAVKRLLAALDSPADDVVKKRMPIREAMEYFFSTCVVKREVPRESIAFGDRVAARGLCGIELKYPATNTEAAFDYSYDHGFKIYQADVRLTSDKELVCVDRWGRETFKKLGLALGEGEDPFALSAKTYRDAKYYGRFDSSSFDSFILHARERIESAGLKIILSVGRPSQVDLLSMVDCIKRSLQSNSLPLDSFVLKLESKKDVEAVRATEPAIPLMLHVLKPKADPEETIRICKESAKWCKKHGVGYLSLHPDLWTDGMAKALRRQPVKVCLFTLVKTGRIIDCLNRGADIVVSQYYSVDYLKRLTS